MKKHIEEMRKAAESLIVFLEKRGVYFSNDEELDNVIFYDNETEYKISHHCFYRFSGPCVIYKTTTSKRGQEMIEPIFITKEMFYDIYMKPALIKIFNIK